MRKLLLALLLLPSLVSAADIIASGVTEENNTYTLYVYARIDAPLPMVHAAITDFANLATINPSIEESQVLMQTPDQQRVRTVVRVCINDGAGCGRFSFRVRTLDPASAEWRYTPAFH
jgi:hypothetical protein